MKKKKLIIIIGVVLAILIISFFIPIERHEINPYGYDLGYAIDTKIPYGYYNIYGIKIYEIEE